MNQFGYPQGQGPGPYGWNPGYGGPPFNYSNFGNSLMQGMGGGYGGGFGWPEQNMGGYGGGYGMQSYFPEAQMFGNEMGGTIQGGDPYGGMGGFGFDPYAMGQSMMGYY